MPSPDMYERAYWDVQRVLDRAHGTEDGDGAGEGIAAEVDLLLRQRDEARNQLVAAHGRGRDQAAAELAALADGIEEIELDGHRDLPRMVITGEAETLRTLFGLLSSARRAGPGAGTRAQPSDPHDSAKGGVSDATEWAAEAAPTDPASSLAPEATAATKLGARTCAGCGDDIWSNERTWPASFADDGGVICAVCNAKRPAEEATDA